MPQISVIVPVYNVEQYLSRCLDSIINQTYRNFEVILVDDGSPDKCPEICDYYALQDNRIKVIHKENGGLADVRNEGIRASSGEFITFIDSDDFVSFRYLEVLLDGITRHNADIIIAKFQRFESKNNIKNFVIIDDWKLLSKEDVFQKYTSLNTSEAMPFISSCNKLYKRSLFDDIEYPKGFYYEDAYTSYKLLDKAKTIVVTSNQLYFYFINPKSIMGQSFNNKHLEMIDAFQQAIQYFNKKGNTEIATMLYAPLLMREIYCWWGVKYILNDKKESIEILRLYQQNCKKLPYVKNIDLRWKIIFRLFAKCPWLYALYHKYSPIRVGDR
jgi:glycosyltransferase involved in cell wall biosynthesis